MAKTVRNESWQARQGDELLIRGGRKPPKEAVDVPASGGRTVIAFGLSTGHNHSFPEQVKLKRLNAQSLSSFALVEKKCELTHQEHGPIETAPGEYEVRQQRQWTLGRMQRVID